MAMQGYLRRTATYVGTLIECQGLVVRPTPSKFKDFSTVRA